VSSEVVEVVVEDVVVVAVVVEFEAVDLGYLVQDLLAADAGLGLDLDLRVRVDQTDFVVFVDLAELDSADVADLTMTLDAVEAFVTFVALDEAVAAELALDIRLRRRSHLEGVEVDVAEAAEIEEMEEMEEMKVMGVSVAVEAVEGTDEMVEVVERVDSEVVRARGVCAVPRAEMERRARLRSWLEDIVKR
jgi:hypothetical protein